jgi:CubicO group peptidase (beta-lactamase class C family)
VIKADGGLFTTASDWCHFNMMLLAKGAVGSSGARLLSEVSWELMVAPATPDLSTEFNSHWDDAPDSSGPALCANHRGGGFAHSLVGEVVTDPARAQQVLGCSAGAFGWEGIFTTKFMVDPASDIGFAAFSQVHPCWAFNLKRELGPLIFGAAAAGTTSSGIPSSSSGSKL